MKARKILSLALALVLCLGLMTPALALGYGEEYNGYNPTYGRQYSDVPATHWASQSIQTCSERSWFNGYPDGTFRPESLIRRDEAAKVFAVAMGLTIEDNPTLTFTDTKDNWAKAYIEATKPLFPNVANLQGTTSFRPAQTITREETIYALVVAWGYGSKTKNADLSILNMFSDTNSISAGVKPYMAVAVSEGLVSGLPDGTIAAQKGLSRAEFAALLARALSHGYGDTKQEFQAPKITLNQYASITDQAKVTVTGSVTPAADVALTLDGSDVKVGSNGSFTLSLSLKTGNNSFTLTAENAYGAKDTKTIEVERTDKLSISLDSYPDTTAEGKLTVTGTVSPANDVELTLDGSDVKVSSRGSFTLSLSLKVGSNSFTLTAENSYGGKATKTITVERTENLAISIDPFEDNTSEDEITITGTVTPPTGVTLTVDGQEVPTTSAGGFQVTLPLESGVNNFVFAAKNTNGSTAEKSITVGREFQLPSLLIDEYTTPGHSGPGGGEGEDFLITGRIANYNDNCQLCYVSHENGMEYTYVAVNADGTFEIPFSARTPGLLHWIEIELDYDYRTLETAYYEYCCWDTEHAGEWIEELPQSVIDNADYYSIESKTQYRYKTIETKTSSESSLPGWTLVQQGGSWGAWSSWQDSNVNSSSTRKVETRQVETAPGKTEYRYGGWHDSSNFGHFCPNLGKSSRGTTFTLHYTDWSTTRQTPKYTNWQYCDNTSHNHVGGRNYNGHHYWDRYGINGLAYYWEETRTTQPTYKTQYRYQDYTASNVFQRETDWSDWVEEGEMPITWSTMDVRTLFYYVPNI